MKQLKKEQQRETKDLGDQMNKLEVVSFQNYFPEIKPTVVTFFVEKPYYTHYDCKYTKDITLLVFKPPRAVV